MTSVSTVLTRKFLKVSRRQCFMWTVILVSASTCVRPIWRSSLTPAELHLTSLFTITPPKSYVNSLSGWNELGSLIFIVPYVLWYIDCFCKQEKLFTTTSLTCMWLQRIFKITITNCVNRWISSGQVLAKFYNSMYKFDESFGSGNSSLRISLKNPELVHLS